MAGEVAPISTQPRRGRFSVSVRKCPPTLRQCPATGHDFGSSVRECPVTLRTRSTSFTVGIGAATARREATRTPLRRCCRLGHADYRVDAARRSAVLPVACRNRRNPYRLPAVPSFGFATPTAAQGWAVTTAPDRRFAPGVVGGRIRFRRAHTGGSATPTRDE